MGAGEVKRDRWGRALIVPPNGGKAVPYLRPSSLPDELGDRFNIEQWKLRQCALGMARRPDLIAHAATLTAKDTGKLREIVEAALEMVAESTGANFGSAIHAYIENRLDPSSAGWIPEQTVNAAMGVRRALELNGFELVEGTSETFVVNDEIRAAGSLDGLVARDGQTFIFDIKSDNGVSKVADYKMQKWATQLAIYVRATHGYDFDVDERTELGAPWRVLDKTVGVVAHVSRDTGECVLRYPDLAWGWESAQLARRVYDVKKTKAAALQVAEPSEIVAACAVTEQQDAATYTVVDSRRAWLVGRAEQVKARDVEVLRRYWPVTVKTFKQQAHHDAAELDLIQAGIEAAEAALRLPFEAEPPGGTPEPVPLPVEVSARGGQDDPALPASAVTPLAVVSPGSGTTPPDEGDESSELLGDVQVLREQVLEANGAKVAQQWAAEANAAGCSLSMNRGTRRRHAIGRILLRVPELGTDVVRAFIGHVLESDQPLLPTTPFGAAVGCLGAAEAERVAALCISDGVVLGVRPDGLTVVTHLAPVA